MKTMKVIKMADDERQNKKLLDPFSFKFIVHACILISF